LVFCVGPLAVLGSISDGLGRGADQLIQKSVIDGFASVAFAASFGWGVAASAAAILLVQGLLTAAAAVLRQAVPVAGVTALSATGGVLLIAVTARLLKIKHIAVADLLPALVVAPLLVQLLGERQALNVRRWLRRKSSIPEGAAKGATPWVDASIDL
jgi:uncharacterized membrane protein YqgA involved in biofilm formation